MSATITLQPSFAKSLAIPSPKPKIVSDVLQKQGRNWHTTTGTSDDGHMISKESFGSHYVMISMSLQSDSLKLMHFDSVLLHIYSDILRLSSEQLRGVSKVGVLFRKDRSVREIGYDLVRMIDRAKAL